MIGITAATSQFGQLTIQSLLRRGIPAHTIVAIVRNPEKAAPLAAQGVQVRQADYVNPDGWAQALAGVDRLLLISTGHMQDRVAQHTTAVNAAKAAGVNLLAYTSLLKADTSTLSMAPDHLGTEEVIRNSGLPFVFLRNGWYFENYNMPQTLQTGVMLGAAGDSRVSAATRADLADAAAAVLSGTGHENRVYELGGDQAFTLSELAAEIGRQSGKTVQYQDLPEADYARTLEGFGIPALYSNMLASADSAMKRGDKQTDSTHLRELIGRPTTTLMEAVAAQIGR